MRHLRFTHRAIRRVAEHRIRAAMEEGVFDDLPGAGRPIPGIDEPYDPDWWIKSWLERERLKELGKPRGRRKKLLRLYQARELRGL